VPCVVRNDYEGVSCRISTSAIVSYLRSAIFLFCSNFGSLRKVNCLMILSGMSL